MTAFLAPALAGLWRVAAFIVPVPLGIIAACGLWLWLDTSSKVRKAVDDAVVELVAGARITALEETVVAERKTSAFLRLHRDEARRIAQDTEAARQELADERVIAQLEREDYAREIAMLQAKPTRLGCIADRAFIDRLRSK